MWIEGTRQEEGWPRCLSDREVMAEKRREGEREIESKKERKRDEQNEKNKIKLKGG